MQYQIKKTKNYYILGNLYAKRDWGHARDYVEAMWKMLQKKNHQIMSSLLENNTQVKEFVNLVLKELNIKYSWKGKGINEKCFDENG